MAVQVLVKWHGSSMMCNYAVDRTGEALHYSVNEQSRVLDGFTRQPSPPKRICHIWKPGEVLGTYDDVPCGLSRSTKPPLLVVAYK